MSKALIGYTGFVGSNLACQSKFDSFYNSKNIESIIGQEFDLIVCAGAPAVKWLANKEPVKDLESIDRLSKCLGQAAAKKVILISTVDVYPSPVAVNEDTEIDTADLHSYGKHRLQLENFVKERFDTLIVRLPGLFGDGLKKNIIYDLLHKNCVDQIHKDSKFQFYYLAYLWQDIQTSLQHNLQLVNLATEPTSVWEVADAGFDLQFINEPQSHPASYDMRSKYSKLFNSKQNLYMYDKQQVLLDIKDFVDKQKEAVKNR